MCGIFYKKFGNENATEAAKLSLIESLAKESSRRGSDSSGVYLVYQNKDSKFQSILFRCSDSYSILFRSATFKSETGRLIRSGAKLYFGIGHTRMNTDGNSYVPENNQPLYSVDHIMVFNGIITNPSNFGIDKSQNDGFSILKALNDANLHNFSESAKGIINFISFNIKSSKLTVFSNNGSCFVDCASDPSLIVSEPDFTEVDTVKFTGSSVIDLSICECSLEIFDISARNDPVIVGDVNYRYRPTKFDSYIGTVMDAVGNLKRCSKCVLPETHPFISFDNAGVCNFCRNYIPKVLKPKRDFLEFSERARNKNVLIGLSGGRDSCLAVHSLVKDFGIKPLTYTYDWGFNTNLSRRNISRICGSLGLENILISADIRLKRENVRKNILAWLKRPNPGLIPLLMAGDKQFISNAAVLKKSRNIDFEIFAFNLFEKTQFKEELTGVKMWDDASNKYGEDLQMLSQLKMIWFYVKQGLLNPALLNSSLVDTARGFINYYHSNVDIIQFFEYNSWDEGSLNQVLKNEYDWERAEDTPTSWRIGDGTASFYNLAYLCTIGFTENDVLRSNLLREGKITRDAALKLIEEENLPRYPTLKWYFDVLRLDPEMLIERTYKQCMKTSLIMQ